MARPRTAATVCTLTLAVSLTGGLLGTLPANAVAPGSNATITGGGASFDLYSNSAGANIDEGSLVDYYGPGDDRSDAFDGFGYVNVNGTPVSGTFTSDGMTASTAPQTDATTGLTTQLTFAAQQDAATVRILARISSDGAHGDQSAAVTYNGNYGSDNHTIVQSTSSGDTALDPTDNFLVTSDLGPYDPVNTTVFQGPNARTAATATTLNSDLFEADYAPIVVPAGETRYFVFFQGLTDTVDEAVTAAPTTYGDPVATPALLAGLTDEQRADTVNMKLVKQAPSVPLHVTAAQTGPRQVTVSFNGSADAGTSAITGYSVGIAGGSVNSSAVYAADTRSHVFDDLNPGSYTFSVGAISADGASPLAGTSFSVAAPVGPTVAPPVAPPVAPKATPRPTIHLADTRINAGTESHLNGTTLPGALVVLTGYTRPSLQYAKLASTHADAHGHYAFALKVAANTRMRVTAPGAGTSRSVVEDVRSTLSLTVAESGLRTFVFTGSVAPHRAGQLVSIVVQTRHGERLVAQGRTGADGDFRILHRFPANQHNEYTVFARVDRDLVTWGNGSDGRTIAVVNAS